MAAILEKDPYLVLTGVAWDYYWRTRQAFDEAVRITYDRGRMEIMSPMSPGHDGRKKLLARLIEAYAMERDVPLTGMGSITLAREDLAKGAEPDECYYVVSEPPSIELEHVIDLSVHSPPDLVVEIDLSSNSVDKEPIYAAMGVAELWRWDDDALTVRRLRADRAGYDTAERSGLLPELPVAALAEHLRLGGRLRQHEVLKRWRALVAPA